MLSPRTRASFNIGARFRSSPIVDGLEFPAERPVGEASSTSTPAGEGGRRGEDGGAGTSRRRGSGGAFSFSKSLKRISSELGGGEEELLASSSGSGGQRPAKRTLTGQAGTEEADEDERGGEA